MIRSTKMKRPAKAGLFISSFLFLDFVRAPGAGEFLRAYREDGDGDGARFSRRVDAAINALARPWQILEPDPAADYLFSISPVIVPLVGVDEMRRLEEAFRQAADGSGPTPQPDAGPEGTEVGEYDGDGGEDMLS